MNDTPTHPYPVELPEYAEASILRPSHAARNRRYDTNKTTPPEWIRHIHPEGAPYYVHSILHITTDTNIENAEYYNRIGEAISEVGSLLDATGLKLPQDYEIVLQWDALSCKCDYYMVNHDNQTEFWLSEQHSEDLDIASAASWRHAGHALTEHYWTHIEYFPHRPVRKHLRLELVAILRHARIDQMTSHDSTFPYSAVHCAELLKTIGVEASHRFQNYYGEEYARLGRDQRRLNKTSWDRTLPMQVCSILLFRFPEQLAGELDNLFVDNLVYSIHWETFATKMLREWQNQLLHAGMLAIANAILLHHNGGPVASYSGLASLLVAVGGCYASFTLKQRYDGSEIHTAAVAEHLNDIKSRTLGFEPAAALFCLPKALVAWSIILLTIEVTGMAFDRVGSGIAILPAIVMAMYGLVLFLRGMVNMYQKTSARLELCMQGQEDSIV
ncbi:hypothetical protein K474DRAFT_1598760 [Panus rudis PR-1116 ss-1]|nr:hypothetical protein K474DRAFT_1598760 [Panus rudis PR-1116 ss-1]